MSGSWTTFVLGLGSGRRVPARLFSRAASTSRRLRLRQGHVARPSLLVCFCRCVYTFTAEPKSSLYPRATRRDAGRLVADELIRLHVATVDYPQRPGCCAVTELRTIRRSVDADLDLVPDAVEDVILRVFDGMGYVPTAVVHGDPNASNIRISPSGQVGLLDWDESRVDLVWHDLSNLGVQVLDDVAHRRAQRLSHDWQAANAWLVEPDYARTRFEALKN